jgi:hypothetical protein
MVSPLSLVENVSEQPGRRTAPVRLIGAQEQLSVVKSQDFDHRLVVVARSHRQWHHLLSMVRAGAKVVFLCVLHQPANIILQASR